MGSFGEKLKREREMRGVSLDDIAEATKIGTRLLRALEDEQFELLPGGIFNKGFVRAYARYLGLNEEEAVADYLQAAGESAPDPRVIAEQNSSRIDRSGGDSGGSRMAGFPIIPVLILLVVIAAGAGGWHIFQERQQERRAKQDAARSVERAMTPPAVTPPTAVDGTTTGDGGAPGSAAASGGSASNPLGASGAGAVTPSQGAQPVTDLNSPAKSGSAGTPQSAHGSGDAGIAGAPAAAAGTVGAPSANSQPFEVTVRAKDKAWVSIKTDGKITVRGIIGPPDVKTIRANDQVVFWTGNAGAVDLSFNGQPVPIAGGPNEVAVLVITPKGAVAAKPTPASHTP